MMNDDGKVFNAIIKPGDLIFIPVGVFHAYLNIGSDDLEVYETLKHTSKAKHIDEITLLSGAQHFDVGTTAAALSISKASAEKLMKRQPQQYLVEFK